MASFEQRGSKWRAVISLAGKKETATFDTKKEAEDWATKVEGRKAAGTLSTTSAKTVADLLEIYLDLVASKKDSGRWNDLRLRKWMASDFARRRVIDVTTHDMDVWMSERGKDTVKRAGAIRPLSGSTVNREMNLWSSAFTYAVKSLKWIKVNPCHEAARPANASARNRDLLTKREITALCIAGGYNPDEPIATKSARVVVCFFFALETGMRSGEILRLRPKDFNPEKMTIRVAALEMGGRKGSKSGQVQAGRYVPLTARAASLIKQLIATMPEGQEPQPGFTGPPYIVGMNDRDRDALWRKIRDASAVEDLTFHDTKHEACTRLSKIVDVLVLSNALGTKDIRLLRDTYYVNDAAAVAATLPAKLTETADC